ncbi:MAG: DUF4271 domain-containing protein [Bacteroidales bacterium]|nr:DUF4271 domain-containing protein [Bacteroidales bacterium]
MSVQGIIDNTTGGLPGIRGRFFDSLTFSADGWPAVQEVSDSIPAVFLQTKSVKIEPLIKETFQHEWMSGLLLLLLLVIAVLWFVAPGRPVGVYRMKYAFSKPEKTALQGFGFLSPFLFYVNYLLSGVLFSLLITGQFFGETGNMAAPGPFSLLIASAFVAYSLYRLVFISVAGFLFKTEPTAKQQIRLYISLDNLTGFLMLPVLLLILFTEGQLFFYFGLLLLLIANAIKWFQTIALGKSISQFRLYHLIVYLCTLEIIPLLLLIKLVQYLSGLVI